jgi:DNA-binding NarL/FixJ family response regulator
VNPFAGLIERPRITVPRQAPKRTYTPRPQVDHGNPWNLTPGETRALEAILHTGSSGGAADVLRLNPSTVEEHTRNVKTKMGTATTLLAVVTYDRWKRSE